MASENNLLNRFRIFILSPISNNVNPFLIISKKLIFYHFLS